MSTLPAKVRIVDVGPRDGCRTKRRRSHRDQARADRDGLADAGIRSVEATAFVSPKWIPQMRTTRRSWNAFAGNPASPTLLLTPNLKGFEAAKAAGGDRGRGIRRRFGGVLEEKHQLLDR
jgi:hydroxymethylglutaryl-CoA lyase